MNYRYLPGNSHAFPKGHVTFYIMSFLILAAAGLLPAGASSPVGSEAGFFLIQSGPSGAPVIFDGFFIGITPITYPVTASSSPPHTITIAASGYYPYTTQYATNPRPGETITVYADLEPSQSFGTLVVVSNPPGALITVDSGKGQQAPWTYRDIRSGGHLVQAFLSGYEPFITITNVPPGGTITVEAVLKPLSEVGALQVRSSPGGADVYVDGMFRGSTATTVGNLPAGSRFVLLKLVGYDDWSGLVNVRPNQVTIIDIPLHIQTSMKTGFIHIESTPPGASVFVDGVYQGITQAENPLDLTGISPGEHVVMLKLENFQDYTTKVQVQAGKTASIKASLMPVPQPAGSGVIQINSEPSGANIFVDNRCIGITPLTLPSIPSGTYTVTIRLDGYQDYTNTFTLNPGQTAQLQVALTPSSYSIPTPVWPCLFALVIAGIWGFRMRKNRE